MGALRLFGNQLLTQACVLFCLHLQFGLQKAVFISLFAMPPFQPFQPPLVGGLTGADLVRQHMQVIVNDMTGAFICHLVGQRRPDCAGHFPAFRLFPPQRQHIGIGPGAQPVRVWRIKRSGPSDSLKCSCGLSVPGFQA